MPHPLEELRYVARGWGAGDELPAAEVATVLAELAEQSPNMLLQACRRMIEYFPSSGVAWWLAARALTAAEPAQAIWAAGEELDKDPTSAELEEALPAGAAVAVSPLGPDVARALRRRPDVRSVKKLGPAQLLVVTVAAAGPGEVLVTSRAAQAAGAAVAAGKPVWAVVRRGALLPGELWDNLKSMVLPDDALGLVGATWLGAVIGEDGRKAPVAGLSRATCPAAAELRGWRI